MASIYHNDYKLLNVQSYQFRFQLNFSFRPPSRTYESSLIKTKFQINDSIMWVLGLLVGNGENFSSTVILGVQA